MKLMKIATILMVGMGSLVCAGTSVDQPATRPAGNAYGNRPVLQALRALAGNTNGVRPYTEMEWNEMMTFMQRYSPARWHVLDTITLPHDSKIRLDAIRKWRNFNFTRDHFPAIADNLLRRFTLEDDLFALTLKARADQGSELLDIHNKIRDKVAEIVQLDLADRQARIDTLQKMLETEKSRLAMDKSSQDDMIDRRTDAIMGRLRRMNPELNPPATTRPDGPGAAENTTGTDDTMASASDPTNSGSN